MNRVLRRDWAELPVSLIAEVEGRLGAVRGFESRQGGFSYGVLGVATLDSGVVFVKAVPSGSGSARDYRAEAMIGAALPTVAERMAGRCEIWHDLATGAVTREAGAWERAHLAPAGRRRARPLGAVISSSPGRSSGR